MIYQRHLLISRFRTRFTSPSTSYSEFLRTAPGRKCRRNFPASIIRVYDAWGKTARRAPRIIVYPLFYYRRQDKVGSGVVGRHGNLSLAAWNMHLQLRASRYAGGLYSQQSYLLFYYTWRKKGISLKKSLSFSLSRSLFTPRLLVHERPKV